MEKNHTIKIAVINDGTKILPFSMDAEASIFEVTYEFGDAGEKVSLKKTDETRTVEWLIENQKNNFTADYPTDPEDEFLVKERIQELICGKIDEVFVEALHEFRMNVTANVTSNMRHFVSDYAAGELRRESASEAGAEEPRGLAIFKDLFKILSPDCEKLADYYNRYKFDLTDKEKIELLIEWTKERGDWDYYKTFLPLFDLRIIDSWNASMIANRFISEFEIVGDHRDKDFYSVQAADLEKFKMLKEYVAGDTWDLIIARGLMFSVKYRSILFAEYLMDEGADINYAQGDHVSAATYEGLILDRTMVDYIEYYREHGKKMDVDVKSFFREENGELIYSPEIGL